jgi:pyruvate dehydrogenase E2 component (dihydrolipoamide acetyltransferase)
MPRVGAICWLNLKIGMMGQEATVAHDIVMPNAGFDAEASRLIEWLKQPGDTVKKGESIAVIESDKANVELESIAGGVVLELLCQPDEEVKIGAVIARVGSAEEYEQQSSPAPVSKTSPVAVRMAQANDVDMSAVVGSGPRGRVMRQDVEQHIQRTEPVHLQALPKVRRAIREAGLTLESVYAHAQHNPIEMEDVQAALSARAVSLFVADAETLPRPAIPLKTDIFAPELSPAPVQSTPVPSKAAPKPVEEELPEGVEEIPMTRMRQVIARQLTESMQQAPHFYVSGEFDVEEAIRHLKTLPAPAPKINDVLQYLVVQTLLNVPALNATYQGGKLLRYESIHLAIAVSLEEGLLTPVLHDAQHYSLAGLAAQSRALIERARNGRLQANDLSGGTFTISNLGVIPQVDHFTAVINPPQVAILAVGTVKQRPVVRDGGVFVRHTVHLTLSGDHRVVDGMDLGRFMAAFQQQLDRFVRG